MKDILMIQLKSKKIQKEILIQIFYNQEALKKDDHLQQTQPVVKKVLKIPKIEREVQRIETKKKFLMRRRKTSGFKISMFGFCLAEWVEFNFVAFEGEQGDNFYFIISGRVQVLKDFNPQDLQASIFDNEIKQLSNFETFGERAMDSDALRTASVRAIENTHLAYLNKDSYQIIAKSVKNHLKKAYFEEFANLDFFLNWRFQDIKVFYDRTYVKRCSMNATVYKEGDPLDYVYIIKKGEFKIVKIIKTSTIDLNEMFKGDFEKILCGMSTSKTYTISERLEARFQKKKKPVTIKYITAGQMFGEMEFLMQNNNTRIHSVYSVTDQSELYMVKKEYFEIILDKAPSIKNALIQYHNRKIIIL
ncbi:unnamed protein product [Paramecium sonneborni]|uniref:Cyclic nucleotide-binding domain-containing protein n=1 Tax=Paramecium sonneborni TaxID=65129 RepID=A0A8S1MHY8_9CILI|nr:unnamed protein product [Paramecium sonneborni]